MVVCFVITNIFLVLSVLGDSESSSKTFRDWALLE
jgi:hypothetical protein